MRSSSNGTRSLGNSVTVGLLAIPPHPRLQPVKELPYALHLARPAQRMLERVIGHDTTALGNVPYLRTGDAPGVVDHAQCFRMLLSQLTHACSGVLPYPNPH